MENRDGQNPLISAAVSGGLTALIVSMIMFQFVPNAGDLKTSVLESGEETTIENKFVSISDQEDLVVKAVKKASPAVVSVIITKDVPIIEQYYEENPFGNDPFGFFGNSPFNFQVPKYREKGTEKKEVGGGSGFIVSKDGYVVTNKHVVSDQEAEYTVFTNDETKYVAKVVATDPLNDVAILKIKADKDLAYLEFADSEKLEVGQSAIAIGNPLLEFSNSVSVGVVSGLSRSIVASSGFGQAEQLEGVIQTDAAINPGNSGGPLLNLDGKVIGVNVAVATAENIGFALPSNLVKNAFESVRDNGKIVRPYLGVRYVEINEKIKEANKLAVDYGVLILRGEKAEDLAIIPGSPANKAGIEENDIILEIDGQKLDKDNSLARIVAKRKVGDRVELKILSKAKEKKVQVVLEEIK